MSRWLIALMLIWVPAMAEPEKSSIKVLIVDGYGNHDWQRTTKLIQGVLSGHEEFSVEVSTAPVRSDDPSSHPWKPEFSRFDVVVQTCNDINGRDLSGWTTWLQKPDASTAVPGKEGRCIKQPNTGRLTVW